MVFSYSCVEKNSEIPIIKVPDTYKKWAFFDTGTWWLYREENTGAFDSIYVGLSQLNKYEREKNGKIINIKEGCMIELNDATSYVISGTELYPLISLRKHTGTEEMESFLLYKPLEVGSRKGQSGLGYSEIMEINPQFELDTNITDTCLRLLNNRDFIYNQSAVEYQFLRGVGIVRRKIFSKNQDWKLVKYHINMHP